MSFSNLKKYDNITDENGNIDYSKAISNAILGGASAETVQNYLDLRNVKIDANASLAPYKDDYVAKAASEYIDKNSKSAEGKEAALMNLYTGINTPYSQALTAQKKATDAAVQKTVNDLTAQKETTNQSYANLFRQLYQNKMMSKKNMNERLASQGITGGMAESSMLDLETGYSDALRQGEQERINAQNTLDRAISDVKLDGDITKANAEAESVIANTNSYAAVLENAINRYNSLDNRNASWEREDEVTRRANAYNLAMIMLNSGNMPSNEILSAAGISASDAQAIASSKKLNQNLLITEPLVQNYTPEEVREFLNNNALIDSYGQMSKEVWKEFISANPSISPSLLNKAGIYVSGSISPQLQDYLARYGGSLGGVPANMWDEMNSKNPDIVNELIDLGYYRESE